MKTFWKSVKMTIAFCVLLGVGYVFVLWIFAKIASPNSGNAELITLNGQVVGAANVGQPFTRNIYFWGRPSAVDYNGGASGGSNKGPSNEEYLQEVESRIDTFLLKHPYLTRSEVPAELVTASGSGLDPHITPASAYVQVKRVATARGLPEDKVRSLVDKFVEKPWLGWFGPEKVNVLKLNVALEEMNHQ